MPETTITELQLRDNVSDDLNFGTDDGIQSYRVTGAQVKAYILANQAILLGMLKNDIFTGLTAESPAADDYFPFVDVSDANKTKKGLMSQVQNASYRSVTTTDSVLASDETMVLSGASFTSTLPTAVGVTGKKYKFIHNGTSLSQLYTLATTSGQTIGGIASGSYVLWTKGEVLSLESDGANWIITGHYAATPWASYTPGSQGLGTITVTSAQWCRMGPDFIGRYKIILGTKTGVEARLNFPTGAVADSTAVPQLQLASCVAWDGSTTNTYYSYIEPSAGYFTFGYQNAGSGGFIKQDGSAIWTNGSQITFTARAPIAGWQP